jgi:hypothetical protein
MTARTIRHLSAEFIRWLLACIAGLSWALVTEWALCGLCVAIGLGESPFALGIILGFGIVAAIMGLGFMLEVTASEEE